MTDLSWTVGSVMLATTTGREIRIGLLRNGLGLDERKPVLGAPQWALTHVPTGLQVCMLEGSFSVILPVATEIADCAQWSADGFAVDRDLAATIRAIGERASGVYYRQSDAPVQGGVN